MAIEFSSGGPPAPKVKELHVVAGRFVATFDDFTTADWGVAPIEADTGDTVEDLVAARDAHAAELARHEADLAALDGRADVDEAAIADLKTKAAAAIATIARIDGTIATLKARVDQDDLDDAALTARVAANEAAIAILQATSGGLVARATTTTTTGNGLTTTTTGY